MNEAEIRASLAGMTTDDGTPLLPAGDVAQVLVEDGWAAVVLNPAAAPTSLLRRVHRHLTRAFPGAAFDVRAENRVYRGGAGLGEGRHVVAVLGGKGGVGKSTLSINLALTLSALGMSVGLVDGDLNAPDIPHMLGIHPAEVPRGPGWRLMAPEVIPP